MKTKIKYKDDIERVAAVEGNIHLRLVEDARHGDGNYLVFTDETESVAAKGLEERVTELEGRLSALENPVV